METFLPKSTIDLPKALRGFGHINRYWDRAREIFIAKILPGEFYVTAGVEGITTVLGSCVSACIRDRILGLGGMNHFMLPIQGNNSRAAADVTDPGASYRYGNYAMEALINEILKNGGRRGNLEVKIFGGGKILEKMTNIGLLNIAFVRDYILKEAIDLEGEDVGDIFPRKVLYFPSTGKVQVKRLRSLHNNTIGVREDRYMHDLQDKPVGGEVELF